MTVEHGFLFVFNENGIQFAENGYDASKELIKQGPCIKIYLLFVVLIQTFVYVYVFELYIALFC